ncbi:MAG: hypothetical protein Q8K98_06630 [Bacteroidota bacterium]|nr:hypothetical protein [Bacteroidota bacterium]
MKYYLIFFALILTLFEYSFSQTKCYPWKEFEKSGFTYTELESLYTEAVNIDTATFTAFKGREDELYKAWVKLLQDISAFLWKNNFKWGTATNCWNRFYFDKDGTIEHYIYKIDEFEKAEEFEKLMNKFIQDYKFPLTAELKFKQCGYAQFQDKKEKNE